MVEMSWSRFRDEALRLEVPPTAAGALAAVEAGTYAEELGATLAQARAVAAVVLAGCEESPIQVAFDAWSDAA